MKNTTKHLSIISNLLIAIIAPYAWLSMVFASKEGMLVSTGLGSLKYFTVLSNLFAALAAVVYLFNNRRPSRKVKVLKYVAAVSVGLTFVVVMVFLGPLFGYPFMFAGPNFWLHLFVPLLAMTEFVFLNETGMKYKDNLWAVVPMLVYGIFYMGNNIINGIGQWPHTNDWYSFLAWGYPIGFGIFVIIVLMTYGIGLVLRKLNDRRSNHGN